MSMSKLMLIRQNRKTLDHIYERAEWISHTFHKQQMVHSLLSERWNKLSLRIEDLEDTLHKLISLCEKIEEGEECNGYLDSNGSSGRVLPPERESNQDSAEQATQDGDSKIGE